MPTETTTPKKTRKPRRNHALELTQLRLYLQIRIDVFEELDANPNPGGPLGEFSKGQRHAFEMILARLEGAK